MSQEKQPPSHLVGVGHPYIWVPVWGTPLLGVFPSPDLSVGFLPAPDNLKDKCNELSYTATLTFEVP